MQKIKKRHSIMQDDDPSPFTLAINTQDRQKTEAFMFDPQSNRQQSTRWRMMHTSYEEFREEENFETVFNKRRYQKSCD